MPYHDLLAYHFPPAHPAAAQLACFWYLNYTKLLASLTLSSFAFQLKCILLRKGLLWPSRLLTSVIKPGYFLYSTYTLLFSLLISTYLSPQQTANSMKTRTCVVFTTVYPVTSIELGKYLLNKLINKWVNSVSKSIDLPHFHPLPYDNYTWPFPGLVSQRLYS